MSNKLYYNYRKECLRQEAIYWQLDFSNNNHSYLELFNWQCYFEKMGKRYGLLREFRENGVL